MIKSCFVISSEAGNFMKNLLSEVIFPGGSTHVRSLLSKLESFSFHKEKGMKDSQKNKFVNKIKTIKLFFINFKPCSRKL